jgi:hypothetical protein
MNQKTTYFILAAALIAAVGVWVATPRGEEKQTTAKSTEPHKLLDPAPKEITAVEIDVPGKASMAFARIDGKWRMTAPIKTPAQGSTVDSAVNQVRDLAYVAAFKPGDSDRPTEELTGLGKPARVKLTDADGKAWIVKLGNDVPAARQTYVQREGDEAIYIAQGEVRRSLEKPLNEFRDMRIADFPVNEAVRIESLGEEHFVLAKSGENWTIESPVRGRADKNAVEGLLRSLNQLYTPGFVEDEPKNLNIFGLVKPSAKVIVTCEKKVPRPSTQTASTQPAEPEIETQTYTIVLAVGAKLPGEKRFARLESAETPSVFQATDASLQNILQPLANLREKAVARIDTNRVSRIVLSGPDGSVELAKSGGVWEFASAPPAGIASKAAEFAAVDDLLKAIRDLSATGFERADDSLADYGFSSPRASVQLTVEGTPAPIKLLVGKPTPSETGVYVKNEGEDTIAVIKSDSADALAVGPLSFVSRDMLRFDRSRASRLELTRGGQMVALDAKDGAWRFASPIDAAADSGAVSNVLADLSTLRARKVVGTRAQAAEFGLAQPQISVNLVVDPPPPPPPPTTTEAAETQPAETPRPPPEVFTLVASKKDGKAYVMVGGSDTICEVDPRVFDNLDAELLDRRLVPSAISNVTAVTITPDGSTPFTFERSGDNWSLVGEASFPVDPTKVTTLVQALNDLKAQRFASYKADDLAAFGLDKPHRAVTLKTADGSTVELLISSKGPVGDTTGQRFAMLAGSGRIAIITKDDAAKFDGDVKSFQRG